VSFALGKKSRAELAGVHPRLVAVVERAILTTPQDFAVHDGLRTEAEQRAYLTSGASTTMNSKHLRQPDGFGHAVDLVPFINGKLRWEWPPIYNIAAAVRQAAIDEGVKLRWGGTWSTLNLIGSSAGEIEDAVMAYVDRRRKAGNKAFIDGPHYELAP
jgi:peptidoglycan L-alanyl-D-glutamate endopeptidase CwlK